MAKVNDAEITCIWVELDRNSLSRSLLNCLVYINARTRVSMSVSVAMCVSDCVYSLFMYFIDIMFRETFVVTLLSERVPT